MTPKSYSDMEKQFRDEVFALEYPEEIKTEFFEYWSEPNKKGKMLFELQKTWDTKRRIARWVSNQNKWNKNAKSTDNTKPGTSEARINALRNW